MNQTQNVKEGIQCNGEPIVCSPTPIEAGELFLDHCRLKNLSPQTIVFYRYMLKYITTRLNEDTPGIRVNEVTITELRSIIKYSLDRVSTTTVNHTITAIKTLFRFLADEEYIPSNPSMKLTKIKAPKILIKPFSEKQVQLLLEQPNRKRFSGIRDYAMMVLLLDTGLRLSEIINLQTDDVNWSNNTVKVFGKGSKERVIPFGQSCRKVIKQYADRRGQQECPNFFISELAGPLGKKAIQDAVLKYGNSAKITGVRVSPHTFRHTFAVNWIRNSGDVFHLQRILGHSSLEICRNYVNLVTDDLQRAHATYSPMDRMLGGGSSERIEGPCRRIK
ncbi:MAG: tyrosine-type recombinase/integrase [Armatimonadota bacterium]